MGHALANVLVQGEERPLGPQRRDLGRRHPPAGVEERPEEIPGGLGQVGVVGAGHDQGVAVKHGPVVEEGEQGGLVQHHVGGHPAGDDAVEYAFCRGFDITLLRHV